ncbi:lysophospholipid acyltransferase family protein [Pseudonocardia spinosispora]|uniref:lysophospholipid acyltransferase family protein n=1 Tax=Pseudonocardia spinosispora TaxID=103441 RepID=UPI00048BFA0D|nr:lysophospholipid acyltransferase family protein [Pseudonocardia spinosispora]
MLYRTARLLLAPVIRLVLARSVEGTGNVPRSGRVIIASNHCSFIDSVIIALLSPRPVHFLAKAEYFRARGVTGLLMRWVLAAVGSVPVERGTHHAARAALDAGHRILTEERAFGIYPEGSRSRDGRLYRGRTGVAWLALTADAPVVPVALSGTDRLQPIGRRLPRFHRVTVRFGPPVDLGDVPPGLRPAPHRRAVTDRVMLAIEELSGQERAPGYNPTRV